MNGKLDYKLVAPGLCIVATSYGLARYAYGLFLPIFRQEFGLDESMLAYIAAISYAAYFLITLAGIYISTRLAPRLSVLLGGLAATIGMALIAVAHSPLMLSTGVAIAGVSPGLAYTPFSEIIATLVTPERQRGVYSIINAGTSLGVMISGPAALLLGERWRLAWALFAGFGLLSTIWCVSVLPRLPARATPSSFRGLTLAALLSGMRIRLFFIAFLIGIATSIYWAFSVYLVLSSGKDSDFVAGLHMDGATFSQLFWTVVGIAGFAGIWAGRLVERLGLMRTFRLSLIALSIAIGMLALSQAPYLSLVSGVLFGAFFVIMAATLGMWSLELFADLPAVGFGLAFLLLSAGQFVGPMLVGLLIHQVELSSLFLMSAVFAAALVLVLPWGSAFHHVDSQATG